MRHWSTMNPSAVESIEAQMSGETRVPSPQVQRMCVDGAMVEFVEDYPHGNVGAKGFQKRAALSEAQNHRCAYCGISTTDVQGRHDSATIDEVVPRIAGGLAIWSNQVMACFLCKQGRGAMWASRYLRHVEWKGREKANRWGRIQHGKARERLRRLNGGNA